MLNLGILPQMSFKKKSFRPQTYTAFLFYFSHITLLESFLKGVSDHVRRRLCLIPLIGIRPQPLADDLDPVGGQEAARPAAVRRPQQPPPDPRLEVLRGEPGNSDVTIHYPIQSHFDKFHTLFLLYV